MSYNENPSYLASGVPVSLANGGTNATSMSTSTGIVKYDGTRLVTSSTAKIDSSNRQTNTSQPCFLVYLGGTAANVTGNSATYHIAWSDVIFDQGSNFTTGSSAVFTAPVTGKYFFNSTLCVQIQAGTGQTVQISYVATSRTITYRSDGIPYTPSPNAPFSTSTILDMTLGDTCFMSINIGGSTVGANLSGVFGDGTSNYTTFGGYLIC